MDTTRLDGKWVLEAIDGRPVTGGSEVFFEIEGRTISGFDGCNRFGGRLDAPGGVRISQRACAEGGPRLPLDLSDPESHLRRGDLAGDRLELPLAGGPGKATFRREPR